MNTWALFDPAGAVNVIVIFHHWPALTALTLNPEILAAEAVDLLTDLIEDRETERQRIVPSVLIPRRSTASERGRSRRRVIGAGHDRR